jgi:hypothetical protein
MTRAVQRPREHAVWPSREGRGRPGGSAPCRAFPSPGLAPGAVHARAQAVSMREADFRSSSAMETSRILNFWTLPVTVIGKSSTNFQ